MCDGHHRARKAHQELFQPLDRFGVEMVGRFVEQQHVRPGEQQLAERDTALFTSGELADLRIPCRQAQGVGGELELAAEVGAGGGDDRFEARLLLGQLVEIGVVFGIGRVHLLQHCLRLEGLAESRLDFLADGLFRVEQGFLRQIADLQVGHRRRFADDVLVDSCHDAQDRRLARAVETEKTDLRARKERKRDVLDDLPLGRDDLADAVHREYVLSHGFECRSKSGKRLPGARCRARRESKST